MDTEKQAELLSLSIRLHQATGSLHTQAEEVYEIARELEELTKTPLSATRPSG
jgi:hypothetical protein